MASNDELAAMMSRLKKTETNDRSAAAVNEPEMDEQEAARLVQERVRAVDLEAWYDDIIDYTMKTETIPFGREEGQALMRAHEAWKATASGGDASRVEYTDEQKAMVEALKAKVAAVMDSYGGEAFVKFSSRSPKDATLLEGLTVKLAQDLIGDEEWLSSTGLPAEVAADADANVGDNVRLAAVLQAAIFSMKSDSVETAFNLILSSERIYEDIELELDAASTDGPDGGDAFSMGVVVREWVTLPVHHEFRAFVHDGALKAMSQYNHPCYYPRMTEQADVISQRIRDFFETEIKDKVDVGPNYVIDFVLTGHDVETAAVMVIELNPYNDYFGNGTDACLFDWKADRAEIESDDFVFRVRHAITDIQAIMNDECRALMDALTI